VGEKVFHESELLREDVEELSEGQAELLDAGVKGEGQRSMLDEVDEERWEDLTGVDGTSSSSSSSSTMLLSSCCNGHPFLCR